MTTHAHPAAINWRTVIRFAVIAVLFPLVPIAAAGRLDWWQAWLYGIVTIVVSLLSRYLLYLKNPDLIAERSRFTQAEDIKSWDKQIVVLIALVVPLLIWIVAGLDKRYGWSADVTSGVQLVAWLVFLLGFGLSVWAMLSNPYFSSVVRIQNDRGQATVSNGPYRFIRHPGYSGALIAWLVTPLILTTLWAFVPIALEMWLYVRRTALEDRALQAELPGYQGYAQRVPFRLLPGLW